MGPRGSTQGTDRGAARREGRVPLGARVAAAAVAGANRVLGALARRAWPGAPPEDARRVCVWRTGNVGDLVCALPALAAVRARFPEAELVLLTSPGKRGAPGARELLEHAPWIDELVVYHPGEISPRGFAREIAARAPDVLVRLPQNRTPVRRELRDLAFLRLAARARWARGFAVGGARFAGRSADRALARHPGLQHESRRLLGAVADAVGDVRGCEFPLPLETSGARGEADALLAARGLDAGELLVVAPGAKRSTNRWPAERFGEVARRWVAAGRPAAVVGSPADGELARRLRAVAGEDVADLTGASPLLVSTAIFERAAAVLTNDTGCMHLAAAVGTPCVVPYSARDVPRRWFPWSPAGPGAAPHAVLRREPACSPCWLETCPFENRCLADVGVDETWSALERVRRAIPGAAATGVVPDASEGERSPDAGGAAPSSDGADATTGSDERTGSDRGPAIPPPPLPRHPADRPSHI